MEVRKSLPQKRHVEQLALDGKNPDQIDMLSPHVRPRARRTDRATSHDAADSARENFRSKHQSVLTVFYKYHEMTDPELIARYRAAQKEDERAVTHGDRPLWNLQQQSDSGIRSRRAELVRLGYLREAGKRDKHTVWGLK
jgi:hypothetical protein